MTDSFLAPIYGLIGAGGMLVVRHAIDKRKKDLALDGKAITFYQGFAKDMQDQMREMRKQHEIDKAQTNLRVDGLVGQLDALRGENTTLKGQLDGLRSENGALRITNSTYKANNDILQGKVDNLTEEIRIIKEGLKPIHNENN